MKNVEMQPLQKPIATYFLFVFFLPFIKAYFIYLTLYHLFCSILLITRYFVLHFFFLTITSLYTKSHMSNVQPKTNLNHSLSYQVSGLYKCGHVDAFSFYWFQETTFNRFIWGFLLWGLHICIANWSSKYLYLLFCAYLLLFVLLFLI